MACLLLSLVTLRDENRSKNEDPTRVNGKQDSAAPSMVACDNNNGRRGRRPDRISLSVKSQSTKVVGYASEQQQPTTITTRVGKARRGAIHRFPDKLHTMLSEAASEKFDHIVSWEPDGMSFRVHEPESFLATIMPRYFKQTHLRSFQRQLNLYGFCRLHSVCDRGWYYHELFRRDQLELCQQMVRVRVKGRTTHRIPRSPRRRDELHKIPASPQRSDTPASSESSFELEDSNLEEQATMEIPHPVSPLVFETTIAAVLPPSVSPFSYDETLKIGGCSNNHNNSTMDDLCLVSTDGGDECRILSLLSPTSSASLSEAAAPGHHDDDIECSSTLRHLLDASFSRSCHDLVGLEIPSSQEMEFEGRWFHLLDADVALDDDDAMSLF